MNQEGFVVLSLLRQARLLRKKTRESSYLFRAQIRKAHDLDAAFLSRHVQRRDQLGVRDSSFDNVVLGDLLLVRIGKGEITFRDKGGAAVLHDKRVVIVQELPVLLYLSPRLARTKDEGDSSPLDLLQGRISRLERIGPVI